MSEITTLVLGAAAGGGFPQWNCRCDVCRLAWDGDPRVLPRSQAGLAVSGDGETWTLLNASPDLRQQILATPQLRPRRGVRDSPIAAVVLTGAELDQIAGLLTLRERQSFLLYATPKVLARLAGNGVFDALDGARVQRRGVWPGKRFELPGALAAELIALPGKPPLYAEHGPAPEPAEAETVAVEIATERKRLVFAPSASIITPELRSRLNGADLVFFDGTLFDDAEMIRAGAGSKTSSRMGHLSIGGAAGSLAQLGRLPGRAVYIHINNTNPVLVTNSPERREIEKAGWSVAEDGQEFVL